MSDRIDVLFRCPKCGLLTPAVAEVPTDWPDEQEIRLAADCFHCGRRLRKDTTIHRVRNQGDKPKENP